MSKSSGAPAVVEAARDAIDGNASPLERSSSKLLGPVSRCGSAGAAAVPARARRERLEQRRRLGRVAEVEVERSARRRVFELLVDDRLLRRVVVVRHPRSDRTSPSCRRRSSGSSLRTVLRKIPIGSSPDMVELECHFGRVRSARARSRARGRTRELEIGGTRQVARHAERQGDVRAFLARLQAMRDPIGRHLHFAFAAAVVLVRRDVGDPMLEMVEHPLREFDERRLDGALLGELRVVDLLAGPGGFAEGLQADHARAALERMEGGAGWSSADRDRWANAAARQSLPWHP